jgi:polar amino acid transport system substrate-binding protein
MKRFVVVTIALMTVLVTCTFTWAGALDKDVVVVGTESTYPPYEFRDENNELKGFDIDLMEAIADKAGFKIEWQDMPFDSLIPALISNKIDIIAAGLSATPERAERVAFSIPYEISLSTFIVKKGNDSIKAVEDLKGKTVTAQLGTVQETYSKGLEDVHVKAFQKFDDCVREVALGRADATLMDKPVALKFVKQKDFEGKVQIAFDQEITGAGKALAMNLGEEKLIAAVNKALEKMEQTGELQELKEKWFEIE